MRIRIKTGDIISYINWFMATPKILLIYEKRKEKRYIRYRCYDLTTGTFAYFCSNDPSCAMMKKIDGKSNF